jgi:hypothetical protein
MITMTLEQLETRAGQATTHHSGHISIPEALRLAADGKALPVVLNQAGGILAFGRARRLALNAPPYWPAECCRWSAQLDMRTRFVAN